MITATVRFEFSQSWKPRANRSPKAVASGNVRALSRAGAYTRGIVMRMVPKRKGYGPGSSPGSPPQVHTSERGLSLKEMVIFEVDARAESTTIGYPDKQMGFGRGRMNGEVVILTSSLVDLAELHEFGGPGISVVAAPGYKFAPREMFIGRWYPHNNRRTKLTQSNMDALTHYWFQRVVGRRQQYPARPFLSKALEKARPKINEFFKNTV